MICFSIAPHGKQMEMGYGAWDVVGVYHACARTHSRVRLGRNWNESRIGEVMVTSSVALHRGMDQTQDKC